MRRIQDTTTQTDDGRGERIICGIVLRGDSVPISMILHRSKTACTTETNAFNAAYCFRREDSNDADHDWCCRRCWCRGPCVVRLAYHRRLSQSDDGNLLDLERFIAILILPYTIAS